MRHVKPSAYSVCRRQVSSVKTATVVFVIQTSEGDTNSGESGERNSPVGFRGEARRGPGLGNSVRICKRGVPWRARRTRAYNGGLGADPPAGSRGRAWSGDRGAKPPPWSWKPFSSLTSHISGNLALFFVSCKRRKFQLRHHALITKGHLCMTRDVDLHWILTQWKPL